MMRVYSQWIENWENKLCFATNNRVVRPFDWGLEWAQHWPVAGVHAQNGHSPEQYLRLMNRAVLDSSDQFYSYDRPTDFKLNGSEVSFTSPAPSPYEENNKARALWFPAEGAKTAVVVVPHWNSHIQQHQALCRGLKRLKVSSLRISLPYHDLRMPKELHRADYAVSANLSRTIDATRQAVIDIRACFDWLEQQGYERLGIVGTSLGSCYAFLASAHDPRIRVNVFNHCSGYFADVVWTGLSTQHIRKGIEGDIDLDRLRAAWMAISPVNYMGQFSRWEKRSKFIYTRYDTTFLPTLSEQVIAHIRANNIHNDVTVLPCGHYTLGESPFKFIDGYHICRFLKRHL